jgi:hypothetical protein
VARKNVKTTPKKIATIPVTTIISIRVSPL